MIEGELVKLAAQGDLLDGKVVGSLLSFAARRAIHGNRIGFKVSYEKEDPDDDDEVAVEAAFIATVTAGTTVGFQAWAASFGLAGEQADPSLDADGDGASNGLEFGLGTRPDDPSSIPSPPAPKIDEQRLATICFDKPQGVTGVSYRFERSSNLIDWTTEDLTVLEDSATILKVRTESQSDAFVRLVVIVEE